MVILQLLFNSNILLINNTNDDIERGMQKVTHWLKLSVEKDKVKLSHSDKSIMGLL